MSKKDEKRRKAAAARAALFGEEETDVQVTPANVSAPVRRNQRNEVNEQRDAGGRASGKRAKADRPENVEGRKVETARLPADGKQVQQPTGGGIRAERGDTNVGASFDYPPIPEAHYPKKHAHGSLTVNTPVYYGGERYYVEYAPSHWSRGCGVRISSIPIREGAVLTHGVMRLQDHEKLTNNRESFFVHPDELDLAPVMSIKAILSGRTISQAQAQARARGDKDIGDPVALMLREAKTLDEVYVKGAEFLGVPVDELRAKYAKLNPGQQRMNIGNRMRSKYKRENRA